MVSSEANPSACDADQSARDLKRPKSPNKYHIAPEGFPGASR